MIRATPVAVLDTAEEAVTLNCGASQVAIAQVKFILKSTANTTFVVAIEGLLPGGSVWRSLSCIDMAQLTIVAAGSITLSNSTDYTFVVPDSLGYDQVRLRVVSAVSGSFAADAFGFEAAEIGNRLFPISTTVSNVANTITSTSATALAVGPNGTTNPTLSVNSNTASAATGITIIAAASGSGVAVTATGGTNEALAINAKGTGILSLNTTATGQVYHSLGAMKSCVYGTTLTAIGTSQSSTPTAAQLIGGIITQTGQTGAGAVTLPTGTAISAALPVTPAAGHTFDTVFTNLGGGQTLTITGATGTTVVGEAAVATATSRRLTWQCTAANSWTIYCH